MTLITCVYICFIMYLSVPKLATLRKSWSLILHFLIILEQLFVQERSSEITVPNTFASRTCSILDPLSFILDVNWYFFVKLIIIIFVFFSFSFILCESDHLSNVFIYSCVFRFCGSTYWPCIGMSEATCCRKLYDASPTAIISTISSTVRSSTHFHLSYRSYRFLELLKKGWAPVLLISACVLTAKLPPYQQNLKSFQIKFIMRTKKNMFNFIKFILELPSTHYIS